MTSDHIHNANIIVDEIARKLAEDPRMPDQATRELCILSIAVAQVHATLAVAEAIREGGAIS